MAEGQVKPNRHDQVVCFDRAIEAGTREQLASRLLESMVRGSVAALFCNVHMLMLSQEDEQLASAMDRAELVFADGFPVAWLQRRLGRPDSDVLRGFEAVLEVCWYAARSGSPVGFLGSTDTVLSELKRSIEGRCPGLRIPYLVSPPDLKRDISVDARLVEKINSLGLTCLFVGLGCPKQELWVAAYRPHLNCSLLAVGAAFDWLAGTTRMPPSWMLQHGLGWLFRLLQDPVRMSHRYIKYNTKFLIKTAGLLIENTALPRSSGSEK
jgi:N-acetylglucosaminyldiphosphoundecaprenol N-acetyl-beta-D-mannosaminyltransferase